ncbi:MAG: KamA family radical SAM protein [bacterium]|nr:KamA family radical SAM protein [bacterium]
MVNLADLNPKHVPQNQWLDWQWQCEHALSAVDLGLEDVLAWPMRITPYLLSLIDWENPNDPIRLQFFADPRELIPDEYGADPFGETNIAAVAPGIKQRFPDRILAMLATTCSAYCRHCTRRGLLSGCTAKLEDVCTHLKTHPKVREILLSGGDPLMLPDASLLEWIDTLAEVEQLDAIRLCTRTPSVLPMRWTDALVDALARSGRVWVQTQFNHPRELTSEAIAACAKLVNHGIPVSNQSVLLRGVNDDPEVMRELCAKLQRARIRPYYIFQCDPITGISHFRTAPDIAPRLRQYLLEHLGGLACPRVVADRPMALHKEDLL